MYIRMILGIVLIGIAFKSQPNFAPFVFVEGMILLIAPLNARRRSLMHQ